jgi:hypothetical protein
MDIAAVIAAGVSFLAGIWLWRHPKGLSGFHETTIGGKVRTEIIPLDASERKQGCRLFAGILVLQSIVFLLLAWFL